MLHHLVMKTVHVGDAGDELLLCARAFVDAYTSSGGCAVDEGALVRHIGALLLARVYGHSPAAYLTTDEAEHVAGLGRAAISGDLRAVADFWPASRRDVATSALQVRCGPYGELKGGVERPEGSAPGD